MPSEKKEFGSFLPLDLRHGAEYYSGENLRRLNTARSGIFYIMKVLNLKKLLMPRYLCKTVRDFLLHREIEIEYFDIDSTFMPKPFPIPGNDTAVLLVNYFGLLSCEKLAHSAAGCANVIIDNSQAFYRRPLKNTYTVYSPRKFFGVPDGCYAVGSGVTKDDFKIEQDCSYGTSLFLLKRLETACETAYSDRMKNEARLEAAGMREMSVLTQKLLENIDYETIKEKRAENFRTACELFGSLNCLDVQSIAAAGPDMAPMAYPLAIEDDGLADFLLENKVFVGRLWNYLTYESCPDSMEMWLSRFMLPLPVDQRMDADDINFIYSLIAGYCKSHNIDTRSSADFKR